jgi:hypothetical protein
MPECDDGRAETCLPTSALVETAVPLTSMPGGL